MTNREAKAVKKLLRSLRKNWIRVWLICAIGVLSILAAYAAYTEVSSVKRVASTVNSPAVLFSSNAMNDPQRFKRLDSSSWDVTVCNFDQNKPRVPEETDIEYDLEAYLEVLENDGTYTRITAANYASYAASIGAEKLAKYTICKVSDDEGGEVTPTPTGIGFTQAQPTVTFSSEGLKGGVSSTDKYRVTIDPSDLNADGARVFVCVTATRTTGTHTTISGLLYGQKSLQDASTWTGRITDTDFTTRSDYDFYNYLISGSGQGTVDVLWNPNKISINEFFLSIYGSDISTNSPVLITNDNTKYGSGQFEGKYVGWKMITMNVNSAQCSRYEMQLFKGESFALFSTPYSDTDNDYIVCKFYGA